MTAAIHRILSVVTMSAIATVTVTADLRAQTRETVTIRGQAQSLRLYGTRGGIPVIVSSGDGGWIHLGPHVAEVLAAKDFSSSASMSRRTSSTSRPATLRFGPKTNLATTTCLPTSQHAEHATSRS